MPTDLEVVEADEAAGNNRPAVPRGRILVFTILALLFVILAVLSSFRKDRPQFASWVDHTPGVAYYRIDQPHLQGALYEIAQTYDTLHDDLCRQLDFHTTGGAMFRARSLFMGLGRSHTGRIPGTHGGTNQFTIFASRNGPESAIALASGSPRRQPAHLLILEHRPEAKHAYHTYHLPSGDEHIYPPVRMSFARGAYLTGASVPTGDAFTNVVAFYESTFKPGQLGTTKASSFRLPPANPAQTNVYTLFLQSSRGPKLIHITEESGLAHLSIVSFKP